jgi:hypothetical protein
MAVGFTRLVPAARVVATRRRANRSGPSTAAGIRIGSDADSVDAAARAVVVGGAFALWGKANAARVWKGICRTHVASRRAVGGGPARLVAHGERGGALAHLVVVGSAATADPAEPSTTCRAPRASGRPARAGALPPAARSTHRRTSGRFVRAGAARAIRATTAGRRATRVGASGLRAILLVALGCSARAKEEQE